MDVLIKWLLQGWRVEVYYDLATRRYTIELFKLDGSEGRVSVAARLVDALRGLGRLP